MKILFWLQWVLNWIISNCHSEIALKHQRVLNLTKKFGQVRQYVNCRICLIYGKINLLGPIPLPLESVRALPLISAVEKPSCFVEGDFHVNLQQGNAHSRASQANPWQL